MRLFDLRRRSEAGAQRMAAEGALALAFGEIAANAGRHRAFLDEAGDMLVGEPLGGDPAVLARDRPEERPVADPAEPHPGLEQRDGAGFGREPRPISTSRQPVLPEICSSTPPSLLGSSPAGKISIQPLPSSLWPEPQSRPTISERRRAAGEAERQDGAVAQAPQVHLERGEHGQKLVGKNRRLLRRAGARACGGCRREPSRCDGRSRRAASRAAGSASRSRRGGAPASKRSRRPRPARRDKARRSRGRAAARQSRCDVARRRTAASRSHRRGRCFRCGRRARRLRRFP